MAKPTKGQKVDLLISLGNIEYDREQAKPAISFYKSAMDVYEQMGPSPLKRGISNKLGKT